MNVFTLIKNGKVIETFAERYTAIIAYGKLCLASKAPYSVKLEMNGKLLCETAPRF